MTVPQDTIALLRNPRRETDEVIPKQVAEVMEESLLFVLVEVI